MPVSHVRATAITSVRDLTLRDKFRKYLKESCLKYIYEYKCYIQYNSILEMSNTYRHSYCVHNRCTVLHFKPFCWILCNKINKGQFLENTLWTLHLDFGNNGKKKHRNDIICICTYIYRVLRARKEILFSIVDRIFCSMETLSETFKVACLTWVSNRLNVKKETSVFL